MGNPGYHYPSDFISNPIKTHLNQFFWISRNFLASVLGQFGAKLCRTLVL